MSNDKILDRIRKLLAMANDERGNDNERETALRQAHAMLTKHLLGEHVEMHMFVGSIVKGVSMKGYIQGGLVETQKLLERHNDLAAEIERRGFFHRSPLRSDFHIESAGVVNAEANLAELARRCPDCASHQEKSRKRWMESRDWLIMKPVE